MLASEQYIDSIIHGVTIKDRQISFFHPLILSDGNSDAHSKIIVRLHACNFRQHDKPATRSLPKLRSRAVLEKLLVCGTRRIITTVVTASHFSLYRVRSIHSKPYHLISLTSILILSSHLRLGLPSAFLPSGFLTQNI